MGKQTPPPDGKINNVTLQGPWQREEFMAFLQFTTWVSIKKEREDFSLKLTANTGKRTLSNVLLYPEKCPWSNFQNRSNFTPRVTESFYLAYFNFHEIFNILLCLFYLRFPSALTP